jgi:hypothetical protein
MNRRKFLSTSALFAAPAIVKAENIMSIFEARQGHWNMDWENKVVSWIGYPPETQTTVLEFHRWIQEEADSVEGILYPSPSIRHTNNIIELTGEFNIEPSAGIRLKEGSLISKSQNYTNIVNYEHAYAKELNRIIKNRRN